MQTVVSAPRCRWKQFEVRLLKSQEVGNAEMSIAVYTCAGCGQVGPVPVAREILLNGEPLPTSLLNSVPAPRDYGILHQLAYHGATDEYCSWLKTESRSTSFGPPRRLHGG